MLLSNLLTINHELLGAELSALDRGRNRHGRNRHGRNSPNSPQFNCTTPTNLTYALDFATFTFYFIALILAE